MYLPSSLGLSDASSTIECFGEFVCCTLCGDDLLLGEGLGVVPIELGVSLPILVRLSRNNEFADEFDNIGGGGGGKHIAGWNPGTTGYDAAAAAAALAANNPSGPKGGNLLYNSLRLKGRPWGS